VDERELACRLLGVRQAVCESIVLETDRGSLYSRGLSREGFQGGYLQGES